MASIKRFVIILPQCDPTAVWCLAAAIHFDKFPFVSRIARERHEEFERSRYCPNRDEIDYGSYYKQPFAANHYLGSYERYSGRSDNRRSREIYDKKAHVNAGTDEDMLPWLQGFIDDVGRDVAMRLLGKHYMSERINDVSAVA